MQIWLLFLGEAVTPGKERRECKTPVKLPTTAPLAISLWHRTPAYLHTSQGVLEGPESGSWSFCTHVTSYKYFIQRCWLRKYSRFFSPCLFGYGQYLPQNFDSIIGRVWQDLISSAYQCCSYALYKGILAWL